MMTVPTFQEHSNSLYIQPAVNSELIASNLDLYMGLAGASGGEEMNSEPVISNLELFFGLTGASGEVSSRSKVPSPPSRNFCGDEASSFDPCLGGGSNEDSSFSPQLIDFSPMNYLFPL
ncbi:Uncharacterized protein Rs2_27826 [Raphanus sativus]|nr:Uncharacterized protein Rs2_27826 [Raphanus sativus]